MKKAPASRWHQMPCAQCGKVDSIYACGGGRKLCRDCQLEAFKKSCPECGKLIKNLARFCSKHCALIARWRPTSIFITCRRCGKTVRRSPSSADAQFCSRACMYASRVGTPAPWMLTDKAVARRIKMISETRKAQSAKMAGRTRTEFGGMKGPDHRRARHASVRSPNRRVYRIDNTAHFVRTHPWLFSAEDRRNKPAKPSKYGHPDKSFRSNASHGLGTLLTGRRLSWKGWTLVEIHDR